MDISQFSQHEVTIVTTILLLASIFFVLTIKKKKLSTNPNMDLSSQTLSPILEPVSEKEDGKVPTQSIVKSVSREGVFPPIKLKVKIMDLLITGRVFDKLPMKLLPIVEADSISEEILTLKTKEGAEYQIMVLRNVFSPQECHDIIASTESLGYENLQQLYSPLYRNNDRVMVDEQELCQEWFRRMEPFVRGFAERQAKVLSSAGFMNDEGFGVLQGLNSRLRFCKYGPGGVFKKHRDGHAHDPAANTHSSFTVMAYLNNVPAEDGGATRFYDSSKKDASHTFSVQPEEGLVVIFMHNILHDGELCSAPLKYLLRSDLMFHVPVPT